MSNQLKKITTRAKQIRKKKPGMQWKNAIKAAGAEYRSGKLGSVRKKKNYQTGRTTKVADAKRKARKPGKRRSASGKTYTERRKNRSDVPGTLTGVSVTALKGEIKTRLKSRLGDQLVKRELATTKRDKKKLSKEITLTKQSLRKLI